MNSLAQVVLKATSPGVPDFYQGSDLWDLSLVDPDNRRPVDYEKRQSFLADMQKKAAAAGGALALTEEISADLSDGRIKLWTTHRTLQLRQQAKDVFQRGMYQPLIAEGRFREHLIGFVRSSKDGDAAITLLPRFASSLMAGSVAMPLGDAWSDGLRVSTIFGRQAAAERLHRRTHRRW